MRVLIIDTSRTAMAVIRRALAAANPDVEVSEYDVDQNGLPIDGFDWSIYDVVLVDAELRGDDEGIELLDRHRDTATFPAAVALLDEHDIYRTVAAMKAGAADVLLKTDANAARLAPILETAIALEQTLEFDVAAHYTPPPVFEDLLKSGDVFDGQYELMRLIGYGGMSRVYLVKRKHDESLAVIKSLEPHLLADTEMRDRFMREAELALLLDTPHVVSIDDYGVDDNYAALVMEFFQQGDLKQRIESGLSADTACHRIIEIAEGVDALGAAGIVHRDLKPGNIMVRDNGTVAIADLGIAKRIAGDNTSTHTGSVLGTPHYFSPEQAQGQPVDLRSDLYSVGVMLFEMLCGFRPYSANSLPGIVYQHMHAEVPRMPAHVAQYQDIVDRLLAKQPDNRYSSGAELIAALGQV